MEVNHEQLKKLIHKSYETKMPMMIHGPIGVGKSDQVRETAKEIAQQKELEYSEKNDLNNETKFHLIDLRASQLESVDIRGLPNFDQENKTTKWFIPDWLPKKGNGIIFMDEINLALPSTLSAFYQLFLDRRVGEDYFLPDGYSILAAGNRDSDRAQIFSLSAPLANRLLHCELLPPSIETWTCYDNKTEILTNKGWKFFKDLNNIEKVWTLNLKKDIWEIQIGKKQSFDVSTELYSIKNTQVDLMVTSNHKLLLKYDKHNGDTIKRGFDLVEASKLPSKFYIPRNKGKYIGRNDKDFFILPKSYKIHNIPINKKGKFKYNKKEKIKLPEKKILINIWVKFLGYFLSEGNVSANNIFLAQKNGKVRKEMEQTLKKLDYHIYYRPCGIGVTNKQLADYLRQFGKAKTKFIPHEIKNLSKDKLQILLNALMDGDGTRISSNYWRYVTISKKLANDVQEIALKCGWGTTLFIEKTPTYKLNKIYRIFLRKIVLSSIRKERKHIEKSKYIGKVYCTTTKNGIILVRRNGKVCWCGNSWAIKNKIDARVISFLNFKSSYLYKFNENSKDPAFSTPRTWFFTSKIIKDVVDLDELKLLVSTTIGGGMAIEFVSFLKIQEKLNIKKILANPSGFKLPTEVSEKYALISGLTDYLSRDKKVLDKILIIANRLEAEFATLLIHLVKNYFDDEKFRILVLSDSGLKNLWSDFTSKNQKFII